MVDLDRINLLVGKALGDINWSAKWYSHGAIEKKGAWISLVSAIGCQFQCNWFWNIIYVHMGQLRKKALGYHLFQQLAVNFNVIGSGTLYMFPPSTDYDDCHNLIIKSEDNLILWEESLIIADPDAPLSQTNIQDVHCKGKCIFPCSFIPFGENAVSGRCRFLFFSLGA